MFGDRLHARQHLDPRLRLFGLGRLIAEPVDEFLDMGALGILFDLGLGVQFQLHAPGRLEPIIAALIEFQLSLFQVKDFADHPVQQSPVMADQQYGALIAPQIFLQPQPRLQVQVVGGLIQQQQIGLAEQQRRQGNAHPPTAGKIVAGLLLGLFAEPQPGQDAGGAGGRRMGALVMQPVMDFGDPVRIGGGFGLRHQVGQFCITAKHRVDQALPPARRFLRGNPDPPGGRRLGGAAVGVQGTGDQPQQGGLARSVAPDQANPVAGIDRRCRPVKQGPGADLVSDVIDPQHRNSPIRFVDRG